MRSARPTPQARYLELYGTGDGAGADEVFAPDVIDHNPAGDAASGIDGMRALIATVRDGFTGTQHRILFQQELADGWVVLHWRVTGTHTGDAFGFPASGNPVDIKGTDIVRVIDGKITEIYRVDSVSSPAVLPAALHGFVRDRGAQ
ncbi:ester cyclase [Streptomyces sp. NPDC060000]|uniref:ester cyclase n=1 Tax=Streptomyces sp. NPDC060000 TaxID=3347031 RepID=UPI003687CBA3